MSFVFNVDYNVLEKMIGLNQENIQKLINNKNEIPNNDKLLKNIFEGEDIKDVQGLNQYLLTVKSKPIGEGSYNKVYKITINGTNYILRITKTAHLTKPNQKRHMIKEYIGQLIQSTLDHNNIPKVYCIGYTSNDAQHGGLPDWFSKTLSSIKIKKIKIKKKTKPTKIIYKHVYKNYKHVQSITSRFFNPIVPILRFH